MIKQEEIIGALKVDFANKTLRAVEPAESMPTSLDQVKTSPTAFVMPPGEKAGPNSAGTGVVRQRSAVSFQILLVFTGLGPNPSNRAGMVNDAVEAVKDVFIGAELGDITEPITLETAAIVEFDAKAGTLIYGLSFSTAYQIRRP